MPYYLNNASSASAAINIPQIVIGATVGDYVEIKAVANSGNPTNTYRLFGDRLNSGFTNLVEMSSSQVLLRANSATNLAFSTGYTQPAVGAIFTLKIVKSSSTQWQAFLNGSSIGTATSSNTLIINGLFRISNTTADCFRGGVYYAAISDNGGVFATRYYNPSSTSSGTVLPDTVNSANNGNQVGTWPANDSEWVFYSSGASNTVTVSATLPKITGSLTLNEINPSYAISVSGQLPKLTGSVALNEINPVFTVAVAGQLPKLTGSIALNQFANNRQVTVNGILPKLTGAVTLNRIQPNNQASVSGQLPRITASITLRVPDSYPAANPNDYTVSAYLSTDSTYTARLSESSTINAIISASSTFNARLN